MPLKPLLSWHVNAARCASFLAIPCRCCTRAPLGAAGARLRTRTYARTQRVAQHTTIHAAWLALRLAAGCLHAYSCRRRLTALATAIPYLPRTFLYRRHFLLFVLCRTAPLPLAIASTLRLCHTGIAAARCRFCCVTTPQTWRMCAVLRFRLLQGDACAGDMQHAA